MSDIRRKQSLPYEMYAQTARTKQTGRMQDQSYSEENLNFVAMYTPSCLPRTAERVMLSL